MMPSAVIRLRNPVTSGNALSALILSLSPTYYFRHSEPSGAIMVNQVGANGNYQGSPALAQPPIYTGGPSCMLSTTLKYGETAGGIFPASTSISIMTIVKFNTLSGTRSIISRDLGGAARSWQWRTNVAAMEWIKIVGGVTTTTAAAIFVAGTAAHVAVTVSTTGTVKLYKNGIQVATAVIAAANYGGTNDVLQVGTFAGATGADAYFSESAAWCDTELTAGNILACATAAGF